MTSKELVDMRDVIGFKQTDKVLLVGLKDIGVESGDGTVRYKNINDVPYTDLYDKIVVSIESIYSAENFVKLSCLNSGLVAFVMQKNPMAAVNDVAEISNFIETYFWPCNVWVFDSEFGKCVVTDMRDALPMGGLNG